MAEICAGNFGKNGIALRCGTKKRPSDRASMDVVLGGGRAIGGSSVTPGRSRVRIRISDAAHTHASTQTG